MALTALMSGCSGDPDASPGSSSASASSASASSADPVASGSPSPGTTPSGPQWPRTAGQALRQIVAAETAIGDPTTSGQALVSAAQSQQLAYRAMSRHPGWDRRIQARLPGSLRRLVSDNVEARRAFSDISGPLAGTLPAWQVEPPTPLGQLRRDYRAAARRYGIGWSYLAAINIVESASGRIRGRSTAGAQGPMQFLPSTFATYGEGGDIDDPDDAIPAAARFLVAHGAARPGGMAGALYAYNNSSAYVRGVTLIARIMARRPRSWLGYYHWEIYYRTTAGDVHLAVGYDEPKPVPVRTYLAQHPEALLDEG